MIESFADLYFYAQTRCGIKTGDWVKFNKPTEQMIDNLSIYRQFQWKTLCNMNLSGYHKVCGETVNGFLLQNWSKDLPIPFFLLEIATYEQEQKKSGIKPGDIVVLIENPPEGKLGYDTADVKYGIQHGDLYLNYEYPVTSVTNAGIFIRSANRTFKVPFYALSIKERKEQELKPFDKVLVRNDPTEKWCMNLYGYKVNGVEYPYVCLVTSYRYCIPFKGNEHLAGKKDEPR